MPTPTATTRPLVSIHITTYNQAQYIRKTLDSALAQDYPNFEIIVSDDCSKDGTQSILQEYVERFPNLIKANFNTKNLGVTENCNVALSLCKGEFIAFLGGDDLFMPSKISKQITWFENNPDGVICGHDVVIFNSNTSNAMPYSSFFPLFGGKGAEEFIIQSTVYTAISVMVKAAAIPNYGFDSAYPMVSDRKMWIDCLSKGGKFGFVNEILAKYHKSETSVTSNRKITCYEETLKFLEGYIHNFPSKKKEILCEIIELHFILAYLSLTKREYKSFALHLKCIISIKDPEISHYMKLRIFLLLSRKKLFANKYV